MKKIIISILCIALAIVVLAGGFIGYLTVTEYNPEAIVPAAMGGSADKAAEIGVEYSVLTWNIGYCGLGAESDFFMDGGKEVQAADKDSSARYLAAVRAFVESVDPDIAMLQEVDIDSQRSYHVNQTEVLTRGATAFAPNYSCSYVPFPWPPIGKVESGVFTDSAMSIESAERRALPCPFSWPVRVANLKRCLLVSYIPVEGSDKYLVVVNHHLEAYDSGEGKIAQTNALREFMAEEYAKGNYVIAGGDFNQQFPGASELYTTHHPELWAPGNLDTEILPEGWSFVYDSSSPTCRLLNQPYDPADVENTDYYVIDGFIISPNIQLNSVETVNLDFENSDHNPVRMSITLLDQ